MKPNECKYCGCEQVATKTDSVIAFRCWSSYVVEDDYWFVSHNCAAKCPGQLVELRSRISRAIDTLKNAKRWRVSPVSRMAVEWHSDIDGHVTDSHAVDEALAILKGERDE